MIILIYSYESRGPGKVIKNLKLGLDLLGIEYKENPNSIDAGDHVIALQWSDLVYSINPNKLTIGPNICTLPKDNTFIMGENYRNILVPSKWVFDLYSKWISPKKIKIWPVGIDTNFFYDMSGEEKTNDFLIYFKNRDPLFLTEINKKLNDMGLSYKNIKYGEYSEQDLLEIGRRSKFCILLDNTESQGIAILEIMSMNLPMIVMDKKTWDDLKETSGTPATSVPYWSEECGILIEKLDDLEFAINKIKNTKYNPRNFILKNLSVEECAKNLLDIIESGDK